VKCGGFYALRDCPLHSTSEYSFIIIVHPEDKAAIDHHARIVQPPHRIILVIADILDLPLAAQIAKADGLKSDEEATQAASDCLLQQLRLQDGIDRTGGLPQPAHAAHSVEQSQCKAGVAK